MNQEKRGEDIQKPSGNEIDLFALIKTFLDGRKTILKSMLIFMAFGLFIAVFSPKEYIASTTILPSTQGKSVSGNLGGLAAIAGINLGSMSSDSGISPTLYPLIVNSIPFQKELLQTPLTFEGINVSITYEDYYTNYYSPGLLGYLKKYTIGLPGLLIKTLKGKPKLTGIRGFNEVAQIQNITIEENILIKQLTKQLSLEINEKDGYISLSVNMPEVLAAAEMTQKAQKLLQQYIINFKIQKSSEQLKFINERYTEKEEIFKKAQQELASFKDENQFVNSSLANINLMLLQTNYNLAYEVYSGLAKQLETQQIQVKEDTPVFTIINPVSVPIEKAKPNRPMILIIWTFLGCVLGFGIVYLRSVLVSVKEKWNKNGEILVNIDK